MRVGCTAKHLQPFLDEIRFFVADNGTNLAANAGVYGHGFKVENLLFEFGVFLQHSLCTGKFLDMLNVTLNGQCGRLGSDVFSRNEPQVLRTYLIQSFDCIVLFLLGRILRFCNGQEQLNFGTFLRIVVQVILANSIELTLFLYGFLGGIVQPKQSLNPLSNLIGKRLTQGNEH